MRLLGNMLFQHLYQPGLPDTPVTAQQDDMSVSSFGLLPTLQEETNFLLSTDQGCQSSCLSNIQSAVDTTCSEHSVYLKRLRHTSERLGFQVLALKIPLNQ